MSCAAAQAKNMLLSNIAKQYIFERQHFNIISSSKFGTAVMYTVMYIQLTAVQQYYTLYSSSSRVVDDNRYCNTKGCLQSPSLQHPYIHHCNTLISETDDTSSFCGSFSFVIMLLLMGFCCGMCDATNLELCNKACFEGVLVRNHIGVVVDSYR